MTIQILPGRPLRSPRGSTGSRLGLLGTLAFAGAALAGCGTSLLATTPPTPASTTPSGQASSTSTTSSPAGEVGVAFPVVACISGTTSGGGVATQGWKPTILVAPIPTALVGKVEFYSDGVHVVVGPSGWSCSVAQSNLGSAGLVVYPSGNPVPPVNGVPPAGTEGVFATFDNTGHTQGVALVCPYFTLPSWQQQEAGCSPASPTGEQVSMPTPDIASITDPAGVVGSLEGSGGVAPVTGVVIFPQVMPAVTNGSGIAIAVESCSLTDAALCPTILSDFEVREFPTPPAPG